MKSNTEDGNEQCNKKRGDPWTLLFADDNKIAAGIKSNEEMVETQETLNKLYKWVEEMEWKSIQGKHTA